MKPNLLKNSNSQTAVLEKATAEKDAKSKEEEQPVAEEKTQKKALPKEKEERKEKDLKQEHLENKKSLLNAFATNFEQQQEKQTYIKQETKQQQMQEINPSQAPQDDSQEEVVADSLIDFKAKPKKKSGKFRFKLVTAIYAVVLGITVGWVGANAVRLSEVQRLIHAQDVKYVQKVAELDKLKDNGHDNDQLIPWDQILPVQSLPLQDVTEYQQESNWFDNIVNWFGKLFGG